MRMRIKYATMIEHKVNKMPSLAFLRSPPNCRLTGAAPTGLSGSAAARQAPIGWSYLWACCSKMDCRDIGAEAISEASDADPAYVVRLTGERIAPGDRRIRQSPDGAFHWCRHQAGFDAGHTICLCVPPRGF